jgi:hypothetical protein
MKVALIGASGQVSKRPGRQTRPLAPPVAAPDCGAGRNEIDRCARKLRPQGYFTACDSSSIISIMRIKAWFGRRPPAQKVLS